MIVLGIDPGSLTTGWALLKVDGNKIHYLSSGVLKFDKGGEFLHRLSDIKSQMQKLVLDINFDEVALESLIYVKSPTALIKLAQTRGILLSVLVDKYAAKIFEYSPNLVKSTAVGHGHADKESVKKFLDVVLGKRDYKTHDESDAVAVALCHALNRKMNGGRLVAKPSASNKGSNKKGMAAALAHKIG